MLIICIETSHERCSVAAVTENGRYVSREEKKNMHAAVLPRLLKECLEAAGGQLATITHVAISSGPGSYTGLRVGTSFAKGLCFGLSVPLVSVNTLEALAAAALRGSTKTSAMAMLYAGRQEAYCMRMETSGAVTFGPAAVDFAEGLPDGWPNIDENIVFTGNAPQLVPGYSFQAQLPDALLLAEPALAKIKKGEVANLAYFEPDYLKEYQPGDSSKKLNDLLRVKRQDKNINEK